MKILVLGCGGVVGYHLLSELAMNGHEAIGVARTSKHAQEKLDATNFEALQTVLEAHKPDAVVNAIKPAMSVDMMEQRQEEAALINTELPKRLAMWQPKLGYKLVQISTGGLYEGKDGAAYKEDAPLFAHNHYFKTKLEAEKEVQAHAKHWLIARTEGVFGFDERGANPFLRLAQAMKTGKPYTAANDQMAQCISGLELARVLRLLLEKKANGIYNTVGPDYTSRYELAEQMCEVMGWSGVLTPSSIKSRAVFMPPCLKLDISKLEKEIGPVAPLRQQLEALKKRPDLKQFIPE